MVKAKGRGQVKKKPVRKEGRWLAGVDGCPAGWVTVSKCLADGSLEVELIRKLEDLFRPPREVVLAGVDMPIGLLSQARPGGRECDRAARKTLGPSKSSSVFSPPVRKALRAGSYEEALRLNRESSGHGLGISRQAFGLLPKLRELESIITPGRQRVIREVHPELSFWAMNNGRAVREKKSGIKGLAKRGDLLSAHGLDIYDKARPRWPKRMVGDSDILDAAAALFSAERIYFGQAVRLPAGEPPRDEKGLLMEIWY